MENKGARVKKGVKMEMRRLIREGAIDPAIVTGIQKPKLTASDIERLLQHDPLLQKLLFAQQGIANAVSQEFLFMNYCLHVLRDRKERTKIFREENEETMREVVEGLDLNVYIPNLLYIRTKEVTSPGYSPQRDYSTALHQISTTLISVKLAKMLGMDVNTQKEIAVGMFNHDIAKFLLHKLVNKEGELTPYEWGNMEQHPVIGEEIILASRYNFPKRSLEIVRSHHEKLDGSGYPDKRKDLPPHVLVATGADIFDALIEARSYREGMPVHRALDVMIAGAEGGTLDKEVVACLVRLNRETRSSPLVTGFYRSPAQEGRDSSTEGSYIH